MSASETKITSSEVSASCLERTRQARAQLGESIEQGELLGRVVNPHTFEVLEEISNPVASGIMILSHLTRNVVQPGDYGYMVGAVSSEQ